MGDPSTACHEDQYLRRDVPLSWARVRSDGRLCKGAEILSILEEKLLDLPILGKPQAIKNHRVHFYVRLPNIACGPLHKLSLLEVLETIQKANPRCHRVVLPRRRGGSASTSRAIPELRLDLSRARKASGYL